MSHSFGNVNIVDLAHDNLTLQVANLLVESFDHAWSDLASASEEVEQSMNQGCVSRVAIDEQGSAIGWIAGYLKYGRVWELHPLVVRSDWRKRGLGRALVEDFEQRVRLRGGLTITLGTDDEDAATSLTGRDLYQDIPSHIANFRIYTSHPSGFYLKLGYTITGVVPDANGIGKPDILMSKRVD